MEGEGGDGGQEKGRTEEKQLHLVRGRLALLLELVLNDLVGLLLLLNLGRLLAAAKARHGSRTEESVSSRLGGILGE